MSINYLQYWVNLLASARIYSKKLGYIISIGIKKNVFISDFLAAAAEQIDWGKGN